MQLAFGQSAEQAINDLGISKKGKMALNVKPGSDFSKTKTGLLKKKPENLFYDQAGNVFSVVFGDQDNYAEIKYQLQDNQIIACTVEAYITSSAKVNEMGNKIQEMLDKNYTSDSDGHWSGKGLSIEFFDSPDGFNLNFTINQ